jgi:sugar/nucleoside kinase (ribokinase family)
MIDICCIGHITSDKVVTTKAIKYMPGGTAFYFSHALSKLDISYLLVTALAEKEIRYVTDLRAAGITVKVQPSTHTVYFENIYAENQDERSQNVLQKADAFDIDTLLNVDAKVYHLGPLLADDFSVDFIKQLSAKGKLCLDVQGYLRKVVNQKVYATGWPDKKEALQYVDILKADVAELRALTGRDNVHDGAKLLAGWGVKEILITNGSKGSIIYNQGVFHDIPAYQPKKVIDATGCGDTYTAGYLYQRTKGAGIEASGNFAAAMAGLKTETSGPFTGDETDVMKFMQAEYL